MIILKILLGIVWFVFAFLYCILCGIHIRIGFLRIGVLLFLGLSVLLSYFVFPKMIFLILTGIGLVFYIYWESYESYIKKHNFRPNKFIKCFCSWIFVKERNNIVSIVFPRFLTFFVVSILSMNLQFRQLLLGVSKGIDIEVEDEDKTVSIHI